MAVKMKSLASKIKVSNIDRVSLNEIISAFEESVEEIIRDQSESEWEFSGINYNNEDSEYHSIDISDIFDDGVMIVPDVYGGRFSAPRPVY